MILLETPVQVRFRVGNTTLNTSEISIVKHFEKHFAEYSSGFSTLIYHGDARRVFL